MKKFEEMPEEAYQKEEVPAEVLEQWLEEDIALAKARETASKKMEAQLNGFGKETNFPTKIINQ